MTKKNNTNAQNATTPPLGNRQSQLIWSWNIRVSPLKIRDYTQISTFPPSVIIFSL